MSLKKLKKYDIYTYQLAIHIHRYHYDLLPPNLPDIQFTNQSDIHRYHTRQAQDLHTNISLAKNTMMTQGPIIWNTLNKSIKNCSSLARFKNKLKINLKS